MANPIIPMRPRTGKFDLKPEEMNCLNWVVLSGCPRDEAFLRFLRPDYIPNRTSAAVKEAVKQFFAMADVREYMEAYRQTVTEPEVKEKPKEDPTTLEEKKSLALSKLVEYVLSEANNISSADDPKSILDYANKIGIFDMQEQAEEKPRRYLPVSCGDCEYRKFVEENCEEVIDTEDNTN